MSSLSPRSSSSPFRNRQLAPCPQLVCQKRGSFLCWGHGPGVVSEPSLALPCLAADSHSSGDSLLLCWQLQSSTAWQFPFFLFFFFFSSLQSSWQVQIFYSCLMKPNFFTRKGFVPSCALVLQGSPRNGGVKGKGSKHSALTPRDGHKDFWGLSHKAEFHTKGVKRTQMVLFASATHLWSATFQVQLEGSGSVF